MNFNDSSIYFFNFIIMNIKHPLAMGLKLLIQTILVSMISGLESLNILIFLYFIFSIFSSNTSSIRLCNFFSFNWNIYIFFKNFNFISFYFFIMIISLYFIDKSILLNNSNMEIQSISNLNSYMMENSLSLSKLYNYTTNLLTILLMNYLLITLIAAVKITNLFKGPLRPMFI